MKKISVFLCWAIIFSLVFCGCKENQSVGLPKSLSVENYEYQVLTFTFSDSIEEIEHESEYSYWNDNVIDTSEVHSVLSVKIGGQQYNGTYVNAYKTAPNSYPIYTYRAENNMFSVDPDGQLTSFFWGNPEEPAKEGLSQDECQKIATAFVDELVDSKCYQIEAKYDSEKNRYKFSFIKYVNNLKTADSATITVLETGELYSFSSNMLGKISKDKMGDIDSTKVTEAVYKKLDSIYAVCKSKYDEVKYEIIDQEVTVLESGETVMICYVDVDCITKETSGYSETSERIGLVVGENLLD